MLFYQPKNHDTVCMTTWGNKNDFVTKIKGVQGLSDIMFVTSHGTPFKLGNWSLLINLDAVPDLFQPFNYRKLCTMFIAAFLLLPVYYLMRLECSYHVQLSEAYSVCIHKSSDSKYMYNLKLPPILAGIIYNSHLIFLTQFKF